MAEGVSSQAASTLAVLQRIVCASLLLLSHSSYFDGRHLIGGALSSFLIRSPGIFKSGSVLEFTLAVSLKS